MCHLKVTFPEGDLDDDIYQALVARERRRALRFNIGSGVGLLGVITILIGLLLGMDGSPMERLWGGRFTTAGLLLALAGGMVAWVWRPADDTRRLEAKMPRRDSMQRQRNRMLVIWPLAMLVVVTLALPSVWRMTQGRGTFGDLGWVLTCVVYAWLVPITVLGWDGWSRQNRKWLDDELTRQWRAQAMSLGFVLLMVGMTGVYLIGLWRTDLAMLVFPAVLMISGAAVGLRFVWLDRQAEREDG